MIRLVLKPVQLLHSLFPPLLNLALVASTQLDMPKSGSDSAAIAAVDQSEPVVEDHKDMHTESGNARQDDESSPAQKKKKQKKKKQTLSAQMTDEGVKDGGCASGAEAERGGPVLMGQEAPGTAGSAAHVMVLAPFPPARCFRAACFAHIKYASMMPQLEAVPAHLIATFSYALAHRCARLRLRHVRRRRPCTWCFACAEACRSSSRR